MPLSNRWESRLLYGFFIGRRDRHGIELDAGLLAVGLSELGETLKDHLGGATRIRALEAEGQTARWAAERTALVVAVVHRDQETQADSLVAQLEPWLLSTFHQDEIWIAKDEWKLFVARAA